MIVHPLTWASGKGLQRLQPMELEFVFLAMGKVRDWMTSSENEYCLRKRLNVQREANGPIHE